MADIPDAMRALADELQQHCKLFLPGTPGRAISEEGVARMVLIGFTVALMTAAQKIEAQPPSGAE